MSTPVLAGNSRMPVVLQNELAECGLACLTMIACHYGHDLDLASLRRRFPVSLKGASLARLIGIAAELGLDARPLRVELDYLPQLRLPCIVHWDLNHFVVQVQQHESAAMEARAQLELQQQDLLRLQTELARIREQLTLLPGESDARSVQLQRERSRIRQQAARNRIEGDAVVRAPAAGRLSGLLASTGQAVQAGQPLLSLVPADAPLEVELWLPVDAAGMVRAGTAVALRFDAFPYARYGIRRGTVRAVSASPIAADQVRAHGGGTDATAAYRLRVRLLPAPNAAPLPLQPGMQVKADLLLERRRLYRLIVDPLRRPSA